MTFKEWMDGRPDEDSAEGECDTMERLLLAYQEAHPFDAADASKWWIQDEDGYGINPAVFDSEMERLFQAMRKN